MCSARLQPPSRFPEGISWQQFPKESCPKLSTSIVIEMLGTCNMKTRVIVIGQIRAECKASLYFMAEEETN